MFSVDQAGAWITTANNTDRLTQDGTGYTLSKNDGGVERYNLGGQILSVTDPSGKLTQYSYDTSGALAGITDHFGHTFTFTYSGNHIATLSDPAGQITNYTYDLNNNLTQVTYPDNTAKLYHYENASYPSSLTGISFVDSAGVATRYATYAYDTNGLAISTEHAGGQERFTFVYNTGNAQTTVTNAVGDQELLSFTTNSGVMGLTRQQNLVDNLVLTQSFDANNNLLSRQDETGRTTTYAYSTTNQRLSMTEGAGTPQARTTTYQYLSPSLDLPTQIQSPSVYAGAFKTVSIGYSSNLPTTITQSGYTPTGAAVSRTVTLGYNASGQVTSIDGPRTDVADVTTLAYNTCTSGGGCGQLQRVTNALGQVTTYDNYDASGRLLQMTDPNGVKTVYTYTPRGWVQTITQTAPGGGSRVTGYGYDAAGNVTSTTTLPTGLSLTYTYDAAHYLRRVTDSLGNHIDYGYDLKGNRTQTYTYDTSGTLVRSVDLTFDARNHVNQINAGGSITQQIADALGNLTKVTDPNTVASGGSAATNNRYDALNRLYQTIDRLSGSTLYGYDANDRLQTVQAANGANTQYQYDDLGNLLQETSPDRGTVRYVYDPAGNLTQQTDARGIVSSYTYDALNRLTRIDYPGSVEDVTYTYDSGTNCTFGIGRLCSVVDESGSTTYGYGGFGNLSVQTHTELGIAYTTRYGYDAANRVISITYPDGRVINTPRDVLGRITSVATSVNGAAVTIAGSRSFRPDGLLLGQSFGNGLNEVRQYDTQGRLTYQSLGSADTRLYGYDANGNLKGLQSLPLFGVYNYDGLDRLSLDQRTTTATTSSSFTYDANGNRKSENTGSYAYLANSNRLSTTPSGSITLDNAGNTLSDATRSYTYNNAGQVSTVAGAGYSYNAQRLRSRKIIGSQGTVYHYDQSGNLIAETNLAGKMQRAYVWAEGEPLAQIEPVTTGGTTQDVVRYLHTDHLNTPRLATNAQAQVIWRWEGTAFGVTYPNEDVDGDGKLTTINLRFAGQYYDQETGLHYNWNRYYDPKLGRYITSDPVGLKGGLNPYVYANDNPLEFTDPTGLLTCTYQISTHTLSCQNNLGQNFMTSGAKAGNGSCQDKSSCRDQKDTGPLPPGYYPIYPPGYIPKHPNWLFLDKPRGSPNPSNRDQFFIHPWGLSNGCISIYLNSNMDILGKWATQDGGGDLYVIQ
jgi:RHS repeat-associated protein